MNHDFKQKYLTFFKCLSFPFNFFLHLSNFENVTHHHEKTKSFVDVGQLSDYFNVLSPVGYRDNKKK